MKLFACQRSVKIGKSAHTFSREQFALLAPQATENYAFETSLFPLFIAVDIKGLKFLFNCYLSEIDTKSNRILKIPIK